MANRSRVIALSVNDLKELERLVRASSTPAGLSRRARAILLMSEGFSGVEVADKTGYTDVQVSRIRRRFAEEGMAGLHERARSGRPPFDYTAQTRSLVESEYRSVFLKRFPRYAGRARRGACPFHLIDPNGFRALPAAFARVIAESLREHFGREPVLCQNSALLK